MLRNEYLAAENRILRARLPARLRLSDAERATLAEIAKRLGRKALHEIARVDARMRSRCVWSLKLAQLSPSRNSDEACTFRLRAARSGGEDRQLAVSQ